MTFPTRDPGSTYYDNPLFKLLNQAAVQAAVSAQPTQEFSQDFLAALQLEGIHIDAGSIAPDQLQALIQKAWSDPIVQSDWQSGAWNIPTAYGGAGQFSSYLRKALFDDPNSDLIQDGLQLKQQQGQALTATQVRNLGPLAEQVPTPFDPSYFGATTLTFGQSGPFGAMEDGIDYAMPVNTPIYSPFAGTIVVENKGKADWGTRVMVRLDNGYTFAVGHLTNAAVVTGERVNPGEIIGESGGSPSDPNSGESTGPHVEVQWINPQGQFTDPSQVMGSIYGGTTFGSLGLAAAAGTGVSVTDAKNRLLGIDPVLNAKYSGFVSLWKKYFGSEPSVQQTLSLVSHGPDLNAVEDFIRGMPSHMSGMNVGQYFDLRSLADTTSQKILGHMSTDSVVADLWGGGDTLPALVEHYFNHHNDLINSTMGQATYSQIVAANQGPNQAIYNETGFNPQVAIAQYQQAGSPPPDAGNVLPVNPTPSWQPPALQQAKDQPLRAPALEPVAAGGSGDFQA